jgi:hypothetical protein
MVKRESRLQTPQGGGESHSGTNPGAARSNRAERIPFSRWEEGKGSSRFLKKAAQKLLVLWAGAT